MKTYNGIKQKRSMFQVITSGVCDWITQHKKGLAIALIGIALFAINFAIFNYFATDIFIIENPSNTTEKFECSVCVSLYSVVCTLAEMALIALLINMHIPTHIVLLYKRLNMLKYIPIDEEDIEALKITSSTQYITTLNSILKVEYNNHSSIAKLSKKDKKQIEELLRKKFQESSSLEYNDFGKHYYLSSQK